jgi:SPP1 gp7 family putative phage head morphogenesis protein
LIPCEIEKGLASGTIAALRSIFGAAAITEATAAAASALAGYMLQSDATADWVSYRTDAANTTQSESDAGQQFVTWRTAEDERTCDYCGPLDWKIISIDQLDTLDYPPAHVNCRCTVEPVTQAYGRSVPIEYYHKIPGDYDSWDEAGGGIVKPERVALMLYEVALEKKLASTN